MLYTNEMRVTTQKKEQETSNDTENYGNIDAGMLLH